MSHGESACWGFQLQEIVEESLSVGLYDPDPRVEDACFRLLGKLPPSRDGGVAAALGRALVAARRPVARERAAKLLGIRSCPQGSPGSRDAMTSLCGALRDAVPSVRRAALLSIRKSGLATPGDLGLMVAICEAMVGWLGSQVVGDSELLSEAVDLLGALLIHGHKGEVSSIAPAADVGGLWSAGYDGYVKEWSVMDGMQRWSQRIGGTPLLCVAVTNCGGLVAVGEGAPEEGVKCRAVVWGGEPRVQLAALEGHDQGVCCLAFDPSKLLLASCGMECSVLLWAVGPWLQVARLSPSAVALCLCFAPALEKETPLDKPLAAHTGRTSQAEVAGLSSPQPNCTLLSGGFDKLVTMWDVSPAFQAAACLRERSTGNDEAECHEIRRFGGLGVQKSHSGAILGADVSAVMLATCSEDSSCKFWNLTDATLRSTVLPPLPTYSKNDTVASICLSSDSRMAVSGSWDGTLKLISCSSPPSFAPKLMRGHEGQVNCVRMLLDAGTCVVGENVMLASCGSDGTIRIWDAHKQSQLRLLGAEKDMEELEALLLSLKNALLSQKSAGSGHHLGDRKDPVAAKMMVWQAMTDVRSSVESMWQRASEPSASAARST